MPLTPRPLHTLDLLKTVALLCMVLDHVGLYANLGSPTAECLRVLGRPTALIFAFLIGLHPKTNIPWSWWLLGGLLTALETAADQAVASLDVLFALILARTIGPYWRKISDRPFVFLAMLSLISLLSMAWEIQNKGWPLEYGPEALMVSALAIYRTKASQHHRGYTITILMVVISTIAALTSRHFSFSTPLDIAMTAVIAMTIISLWRLPIKSLESYTTLQNGIIVLQWCGRHTLSIYAGHLIFIQLVRIGFQFY